MARMYPATIADDHGSHAERWIFAKLRDETSSGWSAIHSVGLANHQTKPWAEIDFVVVGDPGVFCLEVKGGQIEHRDGDWYTNGHRLTQSPFAQVGGGSSALHHYLAARLPSLRRTPVGYGVLFPDTTFDAEMPSVEHDLVYDDRDLAAPISSYLARLAEHWHNRLDKGRPAANLTAAERSQVIQALAPDFDLVPSLRARTFEVDQELVRLTDRQKELLDGLHDEPRVVVKGGAGTGKTLLACEEATRLARSGQKTLFLCYGSRLADHLRPALEPHGVEVTHLHGLMASLLDEAGLRNQLPAVQARDLFDIYYPQLAIEALEKLDRFGSVDALVLDEGQDLLKSTYVQFLDALLAGETTAGTWRLFYDPNQDIFMGAAPSELNRLETISAGYRLLKNCRNTREIALATTFLSGVRLAETLIATGPEVVEHWASETKQLQKAAASVLKDWLDRGLDPAQITILSPRSLETSLLGTTDPARLPRRLVDVSHKPAGEPGRLRFSTIAGFKGLESDAVLLVDIDNLENIEQLSLLYVGASRAKSVLGLILDEHCRAIYTERVADIVGELIETQRSLAS